MLSGAVAHLGERLLCTQEAVGSIPSSSTNYPGRSLFQYNCSSLTIEVFASLALKEGAKLS